MSSFITPPVQPGSGPGKIQTTSGKNHRSESSFPDAIERQGSMVLACITNRFNDTIFPHPPLKSMYSTIRHKPEIRGRMDGLLTANADIGECADCASVTY
jgi:hypothetical protein